MESLKVWACLTFIILFTVVGAEKFLTEEETKVLGQLRSEVGSILTKDFMKRDEYLLRFLRAEGLDVNKAKQRIEEIIAWRKAENIDTIGDEDFSQVEKCMPARWIGHDRGGRPLAYAPVGKWDTRRCVLAGHSEKIIRYVTYLLFEKSEELLANATDSIENKNSVGVYAITDISGFNLRQGACLPCLPVFTTLAIRFARYYDPDMFYKVVVVNVPKTFDSVLHAILPFLPPQTAKRIQTYGHNRNEWRPILEKDIDIRQLPTAMIGKIRTK